MISMNWEKLLGEYASLAGRFRSLPYHIAKKHLVASMRKAIRDAKGPQVLRKNTPPTSTKRGRKAKGAKRTTGALRRAVMVKAKWIGRNRDGFAVAGLGYKYGAESKKAIYLEFGTTKIEPRRMMERSFDQIRGTVAASLSSSLAASLEKAVAEMESDKNPGMSKRGMAMGMKGR